MTIERWRPVVGFDADYEVSDRGRVRSTTKSRLVSGPRLKTHFRMRYGKIIKAFPAGRSGHLKVRIGKDMVSFHVHTLVLTAFRGPRPEGKEARHLNGKATRNRLTNLKWSSPSDNLRDRKDHTPPKNYKLTTTQIKTIKRALLKPYRGIGDALAEKHGVSFQHISDIRLGKKHATIHI